MVIGWYVHHQGRGHAQRAAAVAQHLPEVTGLSSAPAPAGWSGPWIDLPRDDAPGGGEHDPTAGGVLHWAPLTAGYTARAAAVAAWVARARPELVVVDASVEVALLVRLLGVPVLVVVGPGDREDRPHRAALDAATALLAPWPAWVRPAPGQGAWRGRVVGVGAFSRHDQRVRTEVVPRTVTVLFGGGGLDVTPAQLDAAVAATPGWCWTVLGGPQPAPAENLRAPGWLVDPWPALSSAEVVVTHAGQNALAEVAAARRPAVVLPQQRPHAEQVTTGAVLRAADLAVVGDAWPPASAWPALLATTAARDGDRWSRWNDGDGARRAAELVLVTARAAR